MGVTKFIPIESADKGYHLVSVIIPCWNEKEFIGACLDSIISYDYPKDKLEIFAVDEMSEDGTRHIIERYVGKYPFIRLIGNPKKITSSFIFTFLHVSYGLGSLCAISRIITSRQFWGNRFKGLIGSYNQ
ncbi:MAG: glycosyltransferase [Candidatus Hodarchaeota archaeon]